MATFKFALGEFVKDCITGFSGVVVVQSAYMTGCLRYGVQGQKLKDGIPTEWVYFDEDQLVSLKKNINHKIKKPAGPPRMEAPRR